MDRTILTHVQQDFLLELENARSDHVSSLSFIEHTLPSSPIVAENETFESMVVGGTIFRKALMKKTSDGVRIVRQEQKYQPPFHSKKDFLEFVDKELYKDAKALALNFAYPMTPVFEKGRLDGILIAGSKENTFGDLVGEKVGSTLENHIQATFGRTVTVSVANDTICLLLSGLQQYPQEELVGAVIGTGFNFALFTGKDTMVNLEAANFDKFPQSEEATQINKTSANPRMALFEKEISGAYLYKHFNLICEKYQLSTTPLHSTQELDQLSQQHVPKASVLAREILMNSAELTAAAIAGIALFKQKDLTVVVEGSLFWLADGYKQQIQKTLKELIPQYQIKFVKVNHSTVIGAAKLIT